MRKKLIASVVLISIIVVALFLILGNIESQEVTLNKRLNEVGVEFYEEFYYDQIVLGKNEAEVEEFLGSFKDIGIKVDLENLERFNESKYGNLASEFYNKKDKTDCDKRNTRVIIYPSSPYGKNDYIIQTELSCGFSEED